METQHAPALVFQPSSPEERAVAISSGYEHALLLSENGAVRSFGCAERGRLGRVAKADVDAVASGALPPARRAELLRRRLMPERVAGLGGDGEVVVDISAVRAREQCVAPPP